MQYILQQYILYSECVRYLGDTHSQTLKSLNLREIILNEGSANEDQQQVLRARIALAEKQRKTGDGTETTLIAQANLVKALNEALERYGPPEIMNTDSHTIGASSRVV